MSTHTQGFVPTSENTRDLRRAFGCFGTGVTVITTQTGDGPLGMTANSFSSISLEPPLVLWSPAVSSKRHDAFVSAEMFCIHVLHAAQLPVAHHFATQGSDFGILDWSVGPYGIPTLSDCLATFHCSTHAVHPAGDHSLVLGHVRHVTQAQGDPSGLLFNQGNFGQFTPHDHDQ